MELLTAANRSNPQLEEGPRVAASGGQLKLLTALALTKLLVTVAKEVAWRGYALPRLQGCGSVIAGAARLPRWLDAAKVAGSCGPILSQRERQVMAAPRPRRQQTTEEACDEPGFVPARSAAG